MFINSTLSVESQISALTTSYCSITFSPSIIHAHIYNKQFYYQGIWIKLTIDEGEFTSNITLDTKTNMMNKYQWMSTLEMKHQNQDFLNLISRGQQSNNFNFPAGFPRSSFVLNSGFH